MEIRGSHLRAGNAIGACATPAVAVARKTTLTSRSFSTAQEVKVVRGRFPLSGSGCVRRRGSGCTRWLVRAAPETSMSNYSPCASCLKSHASAAACGVGCAASGVTAFPWALPLTPLVLPPDAVGCASRVPPRCPLPRPLRPPRPPPPWQPRPLLPTWLTRPARPIRSSRKLRPCRPTSTRRRASRWHLRQTRPCGWLRRLWARQMT